MKNKQLYIDLLTKALTVPEHETLAFYHIQDELKALLAKHKTQSLYTKALNDLHSKFNMCECGDYYHYGEDDLLNDIKSTITILNTPLKQLEEEEAAITKQLELAEYHKELPLKLLELLAEADDLNLHYAVFKRNKHIVVSLINFADKYEEKVLIVLNGEPQQLEDGKQLVESVRQQKEKAQQKADLIAAAKSKLTDEEKELLGL